MNQEEMLKEVDYCLKCKNARCQAACPVHTDVAKVMTLLQQGNKKEAQEQLFQNNPLSAICAIVCPHESQCYGHCVRGIKGEPVKFYQVEQLISQEYLFEHKFEKKATKKSTIAIVGGGSAGLASALWLALAGYQVTIFDNHPLLGGVLRYGIPDYRLDRKLIDRYHEILLSLGVHFKPNCLVGPVLNLDNLKQDYDALILALGCGTSKKLGIKGESLGNVYYALDYLKDPDKFELGKHVIVLGAGNVAMDAVRTAQRAGYRSEIYYRKDRERMKANNNEIIEAEKEGIKFNYFEVPEEFTPEGIWFSKGENVLVNDQIKTVTVKDTKHFVKCDSAIIAVSQNIQTDALSGYSQLQDQWGSIKIDDVGHTSITGIYAAGDAVTGAKTVVSAVATARNVIEAIIKELP